MINETVGDILTLKEGILVHGCNCAGVMGGGIAALIREKWPAVYDAYRNKHLDTGLKLGTVQLVGSLDFPDGEAGLRHLQSQIAQLPAKLIVANAMTQERFGRDPDVVYVDYTAIYTAFSAIRLLARDTGLTVNFPLIGCGLANGNWADVSVAIEAACPDVKLMLWRLP